ncbi:MAG: hypothetical protein ACXW3O_05885 [Brevundimonas sp.]
MKSAEKQRILAAYDRAGLVAALASRGLYVIGEFWRDRACGQPVRLDRALDEHALSDDDQPRPGARDHDPGPGGAGITT